MADNVDINIDEFSEVDTLYERSGGQNYDLAYSNKQEKFRLSQNAWEKLQMERHGFKMLTNSKGQVILALVPEDDAKMYSRRYSSDDGSPMGKGKESTNHKMRDYLDRSIGEDVDKFKLTLVKETDDTNYYLVEEWDLDESELDFAGLASDDTGEEPDVEEEAPTDEESEEVEEDVSEDEEMEEEAEESSDEEASDEDEEEEEDDDIFFGEDDEEEDDPFEL